VSLIQLPSRVPSIPSLLCAPSPLEPIYNLLVADNTAFPHIFKSLAHERVTGRRAARCNSALIRTLVQRVEIGRRLSGSFPRSADIGAAVQDSIAVPLSQACILRGRRGSRKRKLSVANPESVIGNWGHTGFLPDKSITYQQSSPHGSICTRYQKGALWRLPAQSVRHSLRHTWVFRLSGRFADFQSTDGGSSSTAANVIVVG